MQIVGKGNTLEYIARELPHIPIPKLARVPAELTWRPWFLFGRSMPDKLGIQMRRLAKEVGYPLIVRSDARWEDGLGRSFAGLFDSKVVEDSYALGNTLERVRRSQGSGEGNERFLRRRLEQYAQDRGVELTDEPIDTFFHRYVRASHRAQITEHPHVPGRYFVDIVTRDFLGLSKKAHVLNGEKDVRDLLHGPIGDDLSRAIADYRAVQEIFPDDISFQAEVTLGKYAFVQWRPFRKREYAAFDINDVAPAKKAKNVWTFPHVLGITPPEGIELAASEWNAGARISETWGIPPEVGEAPRASFFYIEDAMCQGHERKYACAPWQSHDLFRFLERGTHIGFGRLVSREYGVPARYWSDGRQGRLHFVD